MVAKKTTKKDDQAKKDGRRAALDEALKKIEKNFGKGSVMTLGDNALTQIETIPSGSVKIDVALGVGGYPKGRIIEVYGPESSGKTTIALHAVAEVQKQGGTAAILMLKMLWTLNMLKPSALKKTNYFCHNRIQANRD